MKDATTGDYLLWKGKPAKVIGETDKRQVVLELLEHKKCPNCGEDLGAEQIHVIVSSPLFQEGAEKMPTIIDDDSLVVS